MPAEPLIALIKIFAGNFAPRGWAFCDGQLLAIASNTALFSLLGTTYGGDGRTTFGLPDMRSRAPMHPGNGPGLTQRRLGEKLGSTTASLTEAQMPSHTHQARGVLAQSLVDLPTGNTPASVPGAINFGVDLYEAPAGPLVDMAADHLREAGAGAAHDNQQPHTVLNFIIALVGVFPSRN